MKFRCFQKRLANVVSHMRYSCPLNTEANRYFKNPLEPGYHDKMKIITHSKHLKREICWTLQGDDNLQPLFRRELFLGMFWAIYAWSMLWSRVVLILRFTSHLYNSPLAHSHIWHRQAHGHPSEKSADTPISGEDLCIHTELSSNWKLEIIMGSMSKVTMVDHWMASLIWKIPYKYTL